MKTSYKIIIGVVFIILMISTMFITIEDNIQPFVAQTQVMEDYLEALNSEEKKIVYITSSTCSYCIEQKPMMEALVENYGLEYIEIVLDEFVEESLSDYSEFIKSNTYLIENELGTPTIMIVKDGKVNDVIEGLSNEEYILSFFQRHNFIPYDM